MANLDRVLSQRDQTSVSETSSDKDNVNLCLLPGDKAVTESEATPHTHELLRQILLVRHGKCSVEVRGRRWDLKPLQVCRVPPGIRHSFSFSRDACCYLLSMSDSMLLGRVAPAVAHLEPKLRKNLDKVFDFTISPIADCVAESEKIFGSIDAASQWLGQGSDPTVVMFLFMVIFGARADDLQNFDELTEVLNEERTIDADAAIVAEFRAAVDRNYRTHISIAEYCDKLHVSHIRLINACRNILALSPLEIVHERQLRAAKSELVCSSKSATTIAYELGFSDSAYFSRFFKNKTKLSPGEFRRRLYAQRTT